LARAVADRRPISVAFANTHLLYCARKDPALAQELRSFNVFNDGLGADLLLKAVAGRSFEDNLNGTDLVPEVLTACPPGARVYLVGGRPHVVERAAQAIEARWPHVTLCGSEHGYGEARETQERIQAAKPNLVLVAMGNPLQERFISSCRDRYPAVYMGVGALFDFLAGEVRRAPLALRKMRLEWLFRLALEPSRMWRRYALEPLILLVEVYRDRLRTGQ
jgi:exopolysaccharide biosynthesis WecB/TagA/CpsF family protein